MPPDVYLLISYRIPSLLMSTYSYTLLDSLRPNVYLLLCREGLPYLLMFTYSYAVLDSPPS